MIRTKVVLFANILAIALSFAAPEKSFAQKKKKGKKEAVEAVTEKDVAEIDFLFFTAQKEKLTGNVDLAAKYYLEILKKYPMEPSANYEMARIFNGKNDLVSAKAFAERAVKANPTNIWYQRLRADLLMKTGDYKGAALAFKNITEIDENYYAAYFEWASAHANANQHKEAIVVLDKLEELVGINPEIVDLKRKVYTSMGKKAKATEEAERLVASEPLNIDYQLFLGQVYLEDKNYDKAFQTFKNAEAQDPDNEKINLVLSDLYRMRGENDKSNEELLKAFLNPMLDMDIRSRIIMQLYSLGATEANIGFMKKLSEKNLEFFPNDPKTHAIAGDLYAASFAPKSALESFKTSIKLSDNDQKYAIWEQVLVIELESQMYDSVLVDAPKAIELFPSQPIPYFIYGVALNQAKNYEKAVSILETGLIYLVNNKGLEAQFQTTLADAHHQLKNHAKSDKAFDNVLKLDPKNSLALNNYAYYLSLRKENLSKAAEMSKKSLEIEPKNASYLDTYAWILYQQGKYLEAKEQIELAIAAGGGESAEVLEHYGDILFKLGDKEKALFNWKKAKSIGTESTFLDKKITEGVLYE